jgi:hypothetical protein
MIQLAYVSSTKGLLPADEIAGILVKSREKNHKRGITGMLLYKGGNVLQVIEGEKEAVLALFEVIRLDERHGGVIKLYQKDIAERDFPEWTMGFHDLNADSARNLEGFSEFFDPNFDIHAIKPSAAARLLNHFKSGLR